MPKFTLTYATDGREIYEVEADTLDEAKKKIESGCLDPVISEVISMGLDSYTIDDGDLLH